MWIGGLTIVPLSGCWLASDLFSGIAWTIGGVEISAQILCIAAIQFISGITWAAYELAMALLFLHGIPRQQRTSLLTLYHFGNSVAMVLGGLIGLAVLRLLGEGHGTYMTLFLLSSVMRLAMVPLLMRVREPGTVLAPSALPVPQLSSAPATSTIVSPAEVTAA